MLFHGILRLFSIIEGKRYLGTDACAAAVRLAQFGDDGMATLQSDVSGAIENRVAENFGTAIRDAEIQRFGLIELW